MMIKNCITENTSMFEIEVDSLPELSEDKYDYYDKLAQDIKLEMPTWINL